jgi:hypothetical protein
MKGFEGLIRFQKWKVDEQRRVVGTLEGNKAEYTNKIDAMEASVEREKIFFKENPTDSSFGVYLNGVKKQREDFEEVIATIQVDIDKERDILSELFQDLKQYEIAHANRVAEEKEKVAKAEEAELNEIGLELHRRKGKEEKRKNDFKKKNMKGS